jgi:hypothetical protein
MRLRHHSISILLDTCYLILFYIIYLKMFRAHIRKGFGDSVIILIYFSLQYSTGEGYLLSIG